MKNKLKPIIILLATLLLGGVVGFMASTYHFHHRMDEFMRCSDQDRFINMIRQQVEPTKEQEGNIIPILEKYAEESMELHHDCRSEHFTIIDSMFSEIKPFLNEKQQNKLKKHIDNREKGHGMKKKCDRME